MKLDKIAIGLVYKIYSGIVDIIINNKILSLILALATLLRFIGIYPGYHIYHSDEGMSYSSAIEMIRNLNFDPGRYDYPSLIPIIHAFLYVFLFIPVFVIKTMIFSPEDLPSKYNNVIELWQQIVIQNQQTVVLFWGRYVTAFFGVLVVAMTYYVAKFYFKDKRIGLVAAFLTAVNFRQVLNSHLGLPDIYNAFFLLFSLLCIEFLMERATLKRYLAAAASIALYFSTKAQIFTIPVFLLIHVVSSWKESKGPLEFIKKIFSKKFLVSVAIIPVIILLINHYHLVRFDKFEAVNSYNLLKYKVGTKVFNFFPLSYLYHVGIGQLISISIVLGMFLSLRKYFLKSLILLSPVLLFMFIFLYYTGGGYYTRNFVTITPLLLIFAAFFIVWSQEFMAKRFEFRGLVNIVILIISVIIAFPNLQNSFISSYAYTSKWEFEKARDFASIHIPEKATIVSHPWDQYPRDKNLKIIPLEPNAVYSLAEMQEEGAEFGFINMDWLTLASYWWMNRSTKESLEFWEKPNSILANTYSAVAAQELAHFSIAKFVKPWQAPDMNFLIVQIPNIQTIEKSDRKEKVSFSFDNQSQFDDWHLITALGENRKIVFDGNIGKTNPGSIKIERGIHRFPVFMAMSPAISVSNNKAYLIEGWIKNSDLQSIKERDGVIRVEFYQSDPSFNLKNRSLYGSLSSRVFGEPGWHKKEILLFPPTDARFMTVSVQVNNYSEFWFDDIKVYESKVKFENLQKPPYLDYRIPDDVLFPHSQGGL